MSYDFNNADHQQNGFDLIPAGTIVPLVMTIRPGGSGEGGWLKASNNSDAEMLDCEFVVDSGPYAKRKLWQFMVLSGCKLNDKGDSIAGNISRSTLRAILESARTIMPDDMSDAAVRARIINGWQDFCGIVFLAKIGVEKDKTGQYGDKNKIATVITPDMKDYSDGGQSANAKITTTATTTNSSQAASPAPKWGGTPSSSGAPATASPAGMPPTQSQPQSTPTPAWAR